MKSKLLKLSQALIDLNNSEEARQIRDFINQPEPQALGEFEYSQDKYPNVIRENKRPKLIEDYPSEPQDIDLTSKGYYRDLGIQAYLDLFFGGARLSEDLGSGQYSDTFLATKDGKSIAVKFSISRTEYIPYLEIKNRRASLPDELKKVLPVIYEAREIKASDVSSLSKKIKASEGNFFKASEHFPYKSFVAMELLVPTDTKIKDLMIEPDFLDALIKNEKGVLSEIKSILETWVVQEWDWNSYGELVDEADLIIAQNLLDNEQNINLVANNICSKIFDLKNSNEDLWLNEDFQDGPIGGSFIEMVSNIFIDEAKRAMLNLLQMRISPRDKSKIEGLNSKLSILITEPSPDIKKSLVRMTMFYSVTFPRYPEEKTKDIKIRTFLDKLKALEAYGIRWGDIHGENLMLRLTSGSHGYGDLVVADVGLFKFK